MSEPAPLPPLEPCGTTGCDELAPYSFEWPGRPPQTACVACAMRAGAIAEVMGFRLAVTWHPQAKRIAEEIAETVRQARREADDVLRSTRTSRLEID